MFSGKSPRCRCGRVLKCHGPPRRTGVRCRPTLLRNACLLCNAAAMFLRHKLRRKDGKQHRYWSIVENRRVFGGRTVQRHVLYLGEINDAQQAAWCRTIEAFEERGHRGWQIALFPEDRTPPALECDVVQVRLSGLRLHRPRQWGACWLACELWDQLRLDDFWSPRLPPSSQGTRWLNVLKTLVAYQLIDPGSEWRLDPRWSKQSAMADLLGEVFALAGKDTLYRCLDKLLAHKRAMFSFLRQRWQDLFAASFEVLLYDLTSTYFECDPPEVGKRRFGHSRDKRSDCVQVVIALIVTPDGLPLAYEVMPGNTADKTTLRDFLARIEAQYGKADRTWVMDRGIPTEAMLAEMRAAALPGRYAARVSRQTGARLPHQALGAGARGGVGQARRAGRRGLRPGAQRAPPRQGAGDATAAAEEADQAAARTAPPDAQPRPAAAEARRGQEGGRPCCLAAARHHAARQRPAGDGGNLLLPPELAAPARGQLPAALQPHRRRSGATVVVLSATGGSRAGV